MQDREQSKVNLRPAVWTTQCWHVRARNSDFILVIYIHVFTHLYVHTCVPPYTQRPENPSQESVLSLYCVCGTHTQFVWY